MIKSRESINRVLLAVAIRMFVFATSMLVVTMAGVGQGAEPMARQLRVDDGSATASVTLDIRDLNLGGRATTAPRSVYFCDPEDAEFLSSIPLDDGGKFHLILFSGPGCVPCKKLEQDLKSDPSLATLTRWAHFHHYRWEDVSQRRWFAAYKVTKFPTLVVVPPRDSTVYPYCYVERMTGYDGDAGGLFRRLIEKIRAFIARVRQRRRPQPPDDLVIEVELQPDPRPEPQTPELPDLPADLTPEPEPEPEPPAPPPASYPDYPEAVVVVDPEGLGEKIKVALAERLIERYAERAGLEIKTRIVQYADAEGVYPVARDDTPAVCLTKGGRLIGYVSIGVLQALRANEAAGDETVPALPQPQPDGSGLERLKSGLLKELGDRLAASEQANSEERRGVLALLGKLHERLNGETDAAEADAIAEEVQPDAGPGELDEVVEDVGLAARLWAAGGGGLTVALLIAGLILARRLYRRADDSGRLDEAKQWVGEHRPSQLLQQGLQRFNQIREAGERTRRETAELAKQAVDHARQEQQAAESVARALGEEGDR